MFADLLSGMKLVRKHRVGLYHLLESGRITIGGCKELPAPRDCSPLRLVRAWYEWGVDRAVDWGHDALACAMGRTPEYSAFTPTQMIAS